MEQILRKFPNSPEILGELSMCKQGFFQLEPGNEATNLHVDLLLSVL